MDTVAQPLTREDCAKADMAWDDNANVCGAASLAAEAVPETSRCAADGHRGPTSYPRGLR